MHSKSFEDKIIVWVRLLIHCSENHYMYKNFKQELSYAKIFFFNTHTLKKIRNKYLWWNNEKSLWKNDFWWC